MLSYEFQIVFSYRSIDPKLRPFSLGSIGKLVKMLLDEREGKLENQGI